MTKVKKATMGVLIISILIILVTTAIGLSFWRSHMAMGIDTAKQYIMSEVDFTDFINYQIVTNTYLTGFVMIVLGSLAGIYIDVGLWGVYGFILLIIYLAEKIRTKRNSLKQN